jgi:hypothetical protein
MDWSRANLAMPQRERMVNAGLGWGIGMTMSLVSAEALPALPTGFPHWHPEEHRGSNRFDRDARLVETQRDPVSGLVARAHGQGLEEATWSLWKMLMSDSPD